MQELYSALKPAAQDKGAMELAHSLGSRQKQGVKGTKSAEQNLPTAGLEAEKTASQWMMSDTNITLLRLYEQWLQSAQSRIDEQATRILELESLLKCDELTGLLNRRGFFERLEGELDRARRGITQGGLFLMIDLDNFKTINDTYGHQAGDAVLRLVARTLTQNSRAMDACARLGGDEFVLLFANTEKDKALTRAQNLMRQINSLSLVWYGAELPVRASIGLHNYSGKEAAEDIFGAADEKMYENKRNAAHRMAGKRADSGH
jgi:diguanylate cyclase (GGDEF)-like protein